MEIIRFKIKIYLVIKQDIFEFSSESRVYKNEQSAGNTLDFFLRTAHFHKLYFPTKFKNILLNHLINCNFKSNYFHKYLLRKKKLEAFSLTIKQIK